MIGTDRKPGADCQWKIVALAGPHPPATAPQAGLIDTEPTSELAVIAYGELADRRTVIVDVPTNVRVLIL